MCAEFRWTTNHDLPPVPPCAPLSRLPCHHPRLYSSCLSETPNWRLLSTPSLEGPVETFKEGDRVSTTCTSMVEIRGDGMGWGEMAPYRMIR